MIVGAGLVLGAVTASAGRAVLAQHLGDEVLHLTALLDADQTHSERGE